MEIPEDKMFTPRELRMKLAEYALKQSEFAEIVGISQTHVSRVLHGGRSSRLLRLRIAEVIGQLDREQANQPPPPTQPDGIEPRVRGL